MMHTRVVDKLCKACIISHAQLIHHTYAKSGMVMIFRNAISKVGKCAAKAAGKEEGKKRSVKIIGATKDECGFYCSRHDSFIWHGLISF